MFRNHSRFVAATLAQVPALSLLVAPSAVAQEFEVAFLVPTGSGGISTSTTVVSFTGADIDSFGKWRTTVRYDANTVAALGDEYLRAGDQAWVQEGEFLAFPAGARVGQIGPFAATSDDTTVVLVDLIGGQECLVVQDRGVLLSGDPAFVQGASTSATWTTFRAPETARDALFQRALVRGEVHDPGSPPPLDREFLAHVTVSGAFTGQPVTAVHEGMSLPHLGAFIDDISTDRYGADIAGGGQVAWIGRLSGAPSANGHVVMRDQQMLVREGDPAPGFLYSYADFSGAAVSLNTGGDWALRTHLVAPNDRDEVIVKNGALIAAEGSSLLGISPSVFTSLAGPAFGKGPVELDEDGRLLWFGRWGSAASPGGPISGVRAGLFIDSKLIAAEGVTTIGGRLLQSIDGDEGSYAFAPGGGHVIFSGTLGAPGPLQRGLFVTRIPLGDEYCPNAANSTGVPARLEAHGSLYGFHNSFRLEARDLPPGAVSIFLVGSTQTSLPNPAGSQGTLCAGGSLGRFTHLVGAASGGRYGRDIDLTALPQPSGPVPVIAGSTWNFQCWYRDSNPHLTSNFSSAVSVLFR